MNGHASVRQSSGAIALVLAIGCGGQTREEATAVGDGTWISGAESSGEAPQDETTADEGSSEGGADGSSGSVKLDVGPQGEPGPCGDGPMGAETLSYIWIANTNDQPPTIAKIDTRTMVEVGRYLTRADGLGDPSRTSVASSGHAAVANRSGGVTKYFAYDCPAGPTSAGGPDSELPWGMDACIAWSTDLEYQTQRPIAWAPGTWDEEACRWKDELLWTAGANGGNSTEVLRLDGETGTVLDVVPVPQIDAGFYGPYGGAVDGDGNFWFSQLGTDGRNLVRVDAASLEVQVHEHTIDGYGIQVDQLGRPWICGYDGKLARFTPGTGVWDYADTGAEMFGCMPDAEHLWVGGLQSSIRGIDLDTMQVVHVFALPGIDSPDIHGTSIDFDGKVWGVSVGTMAARVDPQTGQVDYVGGLQVPYTYSDMTGYALFHAGAPEG